MIIHDLADFGYYIARHFFKETLFLNVFYGLVPQNYAGIDSVRQGVDGINSCCVRLGNLGLNKIELHLSNVWALYPEAAIVEASIVPSLDYDTQAFFIKNTSVSFRYNIYPKSVSNMLTPGPFGRDSGVRIGVRYKLKHLTVTEV